MPRNREAISTGWEHGDGEVQHGSIGGDREGRSSIQEGRAVDAGATEDGHDHHDGDGSQTSYASPRSPHAAGARTRRAFEASGKSANR